MSSTPCSLPLQSLSFDAWVECCRISVEGQSSDEHINGDRLLDLIDSLPGDLTVQQEERAGHLLARLLCRFVSSLDRRIVSELARGVSAGEAISGWFTASHRLAGLVVRASAVADGGTSRQTAYAADVRVERALAEIDRDFSNPRYGLRVAAGQVALSGCRLTQLLKTTTGRTFGAHLHQRRIAEARLLLDGSTLSIKEIASRVGYQSTTQLDRHFKKIVRSLPSAYRAASRRSGRD